MFKKPSDLSKEAQSWITQNPEIFNWLTSTAFSGFWFCNLDAPDNYYMNQAFKTNFSGNLIPEISEKLRNFIERIEGNLSEFDQNFALQYEDGLHITLKCCGKVFLSGSEQCLFIKFVQTSTESDKEVELLEKINELSKLNNLFHETNKVARVGGWEVNLVENSVYWSSLTKEIHEVAKDFVPNLETGINFYKEGWSRDKIVKLFGEAVSENIPFDSEFKVITAKGNELWVRSFGTPEFVDGTCVRVYGAFQDIDQRKKDELEYEATRQRFEMIFDNSSIGILLVNTGGTILLANPASLKIFGFDDQNSSKVMEMTFRDLIHPDFLEVATAKRKELLQGELTSYQIEAQFYKVTGELIWCRLNTSIIYGQFEEERLIITQVEDITSRKQLENEAWENAKRFENTFEYSSVGNGVIGLDGKWKMVNRNLHTMLGYNKQEFLKLRLKDVTHPEDRKSDAKLIGQLLENKINTYTIDKRYIKKDGKIVYGRLYVSALKDESGKILYLIGQVNDVTTNVKSQKALKKSLQELQNLMDATTQVSIIETDLEGFPRKFNKGAENLLGYTAEEFIGKKSVSVIHEASEVMERAKELSEMYNEPIEGFDVFIYKARLGNFDSNEWTYIRKDGSKFPVQLVVTATRNTTGKITGYLGVATDISQRKKMEARLLNSTKKAEAANKAKSEFLANMSHEIRTPLNGIIGFTDLLMKTELPQQQQQYLQTVYNSGISLMDIINDILDFSKIEAGKLELSSERVDILELCNQSIDIIKHQVHKKGIEILLNISPNIKGYVYADPVRLRQVLINLMGNAAKFTEKGEIELSLTATQGEKENLMTYHFSIRDTGIGIAPQNLKKIFTSFGQEDASTTRKYGGSGLGLTISNRLLGLMHSKLHVESKLHEGSTFSFEVDLVTETPINKSSRVFQNVNKVLIVDDNENNRSILTGMLNSFQIEAASASNGITALEILKKQKFDLAIIDYNMPYINGIDLIAQIRDNIKLDKNILPIILLHSAVEDDKITKGCEKYGVKFKVTKPIRIEYLKDLIAKVENPMEGTLIKPEENEMIINNPLAANILVVEDNPVNKFLANTIIKEILPNVTLFEAGNGLEAINQFNQHQFDLIFMDIQMPLMGGLEAVKEIRNLEEFSYTPIVALTARTLTNEADECIEAGMDDYLSKPVLIDDIAKVIKKFIIDK
ncbi:PAS domain S-box protein [Gramella sp. AN32]|uniref:histidine kinase n=1 Tax=Christiangramia antarctica TaxID=2058158 RepID=A0ABW5XAU2_9FLAO|nr:PAS domain S-box protein [Gramella sp. AN32]MCM4157554.1 hybrid sensor histidine kinase/response regulator [Gramella sp. AN32]